MAQDQRTRTAKHEGGLETLISDLRDCPIPELARLGRTRHTWRVELCAHFHPPRGEQRTDRESQLEGQEHRADIARGYRNFDHYRLRLLLNHGRVRDDHLTDADQNPPSQVHCVEPFWAPTRLELPANLLSPHVDRPGDQGGLAPLRRVHRPTPPVKKRHPPTLAGCQARSVHRVGEGVGHCSAGDCEPAGDLSGD